MLVKCHSCEYDIKSSYSCQSMWVCTHKIFHKYNTNLLKHNELGTETNIFEKLRLLWSYHSCWGLFTFLTLSAALCNLAQLIRVPYLSPLTPCFTMASADLLIPQMILLLTFQQSLFPNDWNQVTYILQQDSLKNSCNYYMNYWLLLHNRGSEQGPEFFYDYNGAKLRSIITWTWPQKDCCPTRN